MTAPAQRAPQKEKADFYYRMAVNDVNASLGKPINYAYYYSDFDTAVEKLFELSDPRGKALIKSLIESGVPKKQALAVDVLGFLLYHGHLKDINEFIPSIVKALDSSLSYFSFKEFELKKLISGNSKEVTDRLTVIKMIFDELVSNGRADVFVDTVMANLKKKNVVEQKVILIALSRIDPVLSDTFSRWLEEGMAPAERKALIETLTVVHKIEPMLNDTHPDKKDVLEAMNLVLKTIEENPSILHILRPALKHYAPLFLGVVEECVSKKLSEKEKGELAEILVEFLAFYNRIELYRAMRDFDDADSKYDLQKFLSSLKNRSPRVRKGISTAFHDLDERAGTIIDRALEGKPIPQKDVDYLFDLFD